MPHPNDEAKESRENVAIARLSGAHRQKVYDLEHDQYRVSSGVAPSKQLYSGTPMPVPAWIIADQVVRARQYGERDRLYIRLYVYPLEGPHRYIFQEQCTLIAEYESPTHIHVNDFKVRPGIPKGEGRGTLVIDALVGHTDRARGIAQARGIEHINGELSTVDDVKALARFYPRFGFSIRWDDHTETSGKIEWFRRQEREGAE